MIDPSDETLLDLYFAGDAHAFQEFYRRHSGRVVGFAKKKGLSNEAAEEIRQESFLRLHRYIHNYERGRPALPWFFSIVHNCLVDAVRQSQREVKLNVELSRNEFGYEELSIDRDDKLTLAMNSLSQDQRRVLELKVLGDQSFKEIAQSLQKNETTLRKIFERAKEKMKRLLDGSEQK